MSGELRDYTMALENDDLFAKRVALGDEMYQDALYERYHRLIRHIGLHALPLLNNGSADLDDLVQAGWEYALTQVNRFAASDSETFPLHTYMTRYMRDFMIENVVNTQHTVHTSADMIRKVDHINAVNTARMGNGQAILSDKEIAEVADVAVGAPNGRARGRTTTGDLHDTVRLTKFMDSLESDYNSHSDFSMGDRYCRRESSAVKSLTSDSELSVEDQAMATILKEDIPEILYVVLTLQQQTIIEMYHGLVTGQGMTFSAIATEMGISRQRVQQVYTRALELLREDAARRTLEDYLID